MGMSKSKGSLCKPIIQNKEGCDCFVVPPSEVNEVVTQEVNIAHGSFNDALDNQDYVTNTVAASKTTTESSEIAKAISAYSAYGSNITVTFYHALNSQTWQRTWQTDFSQELDNVHYSYLKIHNFQMKLTESMNFSYETGETRSQLTGTALLYPYFCPNQGDLFIYQVDDTHMGLFRIYEAPERLSIKGNTSHQIKFILMAYLTREQLDKLNACVDDEQYFNLEKYLNDEGALLTSDENDTLNNVTSALSTLINAYNGEFYEDQVYNTYIESPCLYDPYLVEFISKVLTLEEMPGYPTQLRSKPINWKRSFWFKLLDPKMVPDSVLISKCFRVLCEVNYRTAGINALANRCYIAIVKHGKHPYPPFNIPESYDPEDKSLAMQIRLYFDQGKVRPAVLIDLASKILECGRHAQFYFIPIIIFLLKKVQNAIQNGNDILVNEEPKDDKNCSGDCDNCILNCDKCMPKIKRPPDWKAWLLNYMHITKVDDFMYRANIPYADYKYFNEYVSKYKLEPGLCSSFRKGNYHCRCYDWYYDNSAYFIVGIPKSCNTKYSSVAVCGNAGLTVDDVESGKWDDRYRLIACEALDGRNENGFVCNINVVPRDNPLTPDNPNITTGTNPGKPDVCTLSVVRYLLDNAKSVDHALTLFDNINVYSPSNLLHYEFHFMLSDKTKTVVVEIVNNQIQVIDHYAMTDFYLTGYDFDYSNICLQLNEERGVERNQTLTPHASGLERYAIIRKMLETASTESDMEFIINSILFTNAYNFFNKPIWYSEFFADYGPEKYGDLTLDSRIEDFSTLLTNVKELYENRTRDKTLWITAHACIYDLSGDTFKIRIQECNKYRKFKFADMIPKFEKMPGTPNYVDGHYPICCDKHIINRPSIEKHCCPSNHDNMWIHHDGRCNSHCDSCTADCCDSDIIEE